MSRQPRLHLTAHRFNEGSLFYPSGHIVAAFPDAGAALHAQKDLVTGGYDALHDCIYITPDTLIRQSDADLHLRGMRALSGHSLQTRDTHLDLAHEGCHFLVIHAPSRAEEARVIRVLSRVPVRYAIKYHFFAIERLIDRIPSATHKLERSA